MHVRLLQVGYDDDESADLRRRRVADQVREQRGADLVVLPELWAPTGFGYRGWTELAEDLHTPGASPTIAAIAEAARQIEAHVHAGSVIERARDGSLYNTSVLLGPDGSVLARYRKIHRFGFGAGEPKLLEAGEEIVTADIEVDGRRVVLGLATCYDLRFPEQFRRLLDAGAEVVLVPAAWPRARVRHWSLLGRARAVENQQVLVAVNTSGTHARHEMGGHSQVVDPSGDVLAEAGLDPEVLDVTIDLDVIDQTRTAFPVLSDRRL
ncbi:MAG: carbon-nitrogen family hydrolase [Actinomycetales bacterium]